MSALMFSFLTLDIKRNVLHVLYRWTKSATVTELRHFLGLSLWNISLSLYFSFMFLFTFSPTFHSFYPSLSRIKKYLVQQLWSSYYGFTYIELDHTFTKLRRTSSRLLLKNLRIETYTIINSLAALQKYEIWTPKRMVIDFQRFKRKGRGEYSYVRVQK
jgi:hypothetical protein